MTPTQQKSIIAAVAAGLSWPAAALKAGVNLEQLHSIVQQAQKGKCRVKLRFVSRLREAGKVATEASLNEHRIGGMHAEK